MPGSNPAAMSLAVRAVISDLRSYRLLSQVYGVSHQEHDRLHPPVRRNCTACPACGPSP